jgi:hypothetical protein
MKKLLCILTFSISIFATIKTRDYWQCNKDGSIHCTTNHTCCRSKLNPTGYECMPMPEAVCCSSGIGACPKGYICDNKNNSCYQKTLSFLSLNKSSEEEAEGLNNEKKNLIIRNLQSTYPIINNLKDNPYITAFRLISSFIDGIGLFKNIQENNKCLDNTQFFNEVFNLLMSLKNLEFNDSLPKELEKIAQRFIDNKKIYLDELDQCKIFEQNFEDVFTRVNKIISDKDYFEKLSTHSVLYLGKIRDLFEEMKPLYQDKKWEELGFVSGKFVRFVFLWNLDEK